MWKILFGLFLSIMGFGMFFYPQTSSVAVFVISFGIGFTAAVTNQLLVGLFLSIMGFGMFFYPQTSSVAVFVISFGIGFTAAVTNQL